MENELIVQQEMISQIREIMINARQKAAVQVNNEQLLAYWNIGRVIVEHEQDSDKRVWERLFCFESAIYEKILSSVSDSTDAVC